MNSKTHSGSKNSVNCWEYFDDNHNGEKCNNCIVKTSSTANGFLQGTNGGRACMFIANTKCDNEDGMSIPEKIRNVCSNCEFYHKLKSEYDGQMNYFDFRMHLKMMNSE